MREENPLVSLIVRTKDRPKLVRNALRSIASQTYRPIEVVLVNDGGCGLEIEELKSILQDVSLNYIRLEKNTGRAHAGNTGITHAKGDYIGFLDDDDLLHPDHAASLMSAIEQQGACVAYSDAYLVHADYSSETMEMTVKDKRIFSSGDFSYRDLVIDNYIPFMTILFARETLRQAGGFDEQFDLYEDWDMLIRISETRPFYHVGKVTAEYLQWSASEQIAQAPEFIEKAIRGQLKIIRKHLAKFIPEMIRGLVQTRRDFRAREEEVACLKKALGEREDAEADLRKTVHEKEAALDLIYHSHGWKLLLSYYKMRDVLLPEGSKRRAFVKAIFRTVSPASEAILGQKGPTPDPEKGDGICSGNEISVQLSGRERPDFVVTRGEARSEVDTPIAGAGADSALCFRDLQAVRVDAPPKEKNRILVIDRSLPAYDKESGALRMFSLLEILCSLGYRITFVPDDLLATEPYAGDLQRMGIEVLYGNLDIEQYLEQKGGMFSYVIISRPEQTYKYISLARAYAIHSSLIYDTVDLHWMRFERAAALTGNRDFYVQAEKYKAMELFNSVASDITFTVSEEEKKILEREIPGVKTEVVPNIHRISRGETPFAARKDLMFIGGFSHQPNEDAVFYFAKEIFPIIREKLMDIRFFVVGSDPSPAVLSLRSTDIIVTGHVKDVSPYFNNCRVFVSPLRYGAGMKGKIGQSMSFGLPVVTTAVGAEGIGLINGENALVADHPGAFAAAVIRLYKDEVLWKKISQKSVEHIEKNYSYSALSNKIRDLFDGLRATHVNTYY